MGKPAGDSAQPSPGDGAAAVRTTPDRGARARRFPGLDRAAAWAGDKLSEAGRALIGELEPYARKVPGYTLIGTICGQSPLTGEKVARTPRRLVGGMLDLIPGGKEICAKLREAKAIERAHRWVLGRLSAFPIARAQVAAAAKAAAQGLTSRSIEPARRAFGPLIRGLVSCIETTARQFMAFAVRAALTLAGPYGERVWAAIARGRDTVLVVLANPAQFARNLLAAVVRGFRKFHANIAKHLKQGLMGWLFGALDSLNIQIPAKLDLKGLLSLGMQILQLTCQTLRGILVKRLKPRGERKVAFMEGAFTFLKTLIANGFAGVWRKLTSLLSVDRFPGIVVGGIRGLVIDTAVERAAAGRRRCRTRLAASSGSRWRSMT